MTYHIWIPMTSYIFISAEIWAAHEASAAYIGKLCIWVAKANSEIWDKFSVARIPNRAEPPNM